MTEYDYFKQRISQLYVYNRNDIKVMAGWVVTAPQNLDPKRYDDFFCSTYDFLENRYGKENVIQAIVHDDEGGQPHLHFCFVPVVEDPKHDEATRYAPMRFLTAANCAISSRPATLSGRAWSGRRSYYDRRNQTAGRQPHCRAA